MHNDTAQPHIIQWMCVWHEHDLAIHIVSLDVIQLKLIMLIFGSVAEWGCC